MKKVDSVIVGFTASDNGDESVLIVGRQINGLMNIINAFTGEEAKELYMKLVTLKDDKKDGVKNENE